MTTDSRQNIRDRVEGRELAEGLVDLLELRDQSDDFALGFWRKVREIADQHLPPRQVETLRTMNEEEAKEFEQQRIPFGQHEGSRYYHVPIAYLTWIADSAIKLQSYLRSNRGRWRIEHESGPCWRYPGDEE